MIKTTTNHNKKNDHITFSKIFSEERTRSRIFPETQELNYSKKLLQIIRDKDEFIKKILAKNKELKSQLYCYYKKGNQESGSVEIPIPMFSKKVEVNKSNAVSPVKNIRNLSKVNQKLEMEKLKKRILNIAKIAKSQYALLKQLSHNKQ